MFSAYNFTLRYRRRLGDTVHYEEYKFKAAENSDNYMDHNVIDTTSLKDVLGCIPLFLSAKSVLAMMSEESGHILILSAN